MASPSHRIDLDSNRSVTGPGTSARASAPDDAPLWRFSFETKLGPLFVIGTKNGVCAMTFDDEGASSRAAKRSSCEPVLVSLRTPDATFGDFPSTVALALERYFSGDIRAIDTVNVDVTGTAFQLEVWQFLRTIEPGATTSYGAIAKKIGRVGAERAVGAANGKNPVAVVVPCHRVIGKNGALTGYAYGVERKHALLVHEGALLA